MYHKCLLSLWIQRYIYGPFMQTEMGISNDSTIAHIFLAAAGGWIFSVLLVGFLCKHNLGGEYLQTYSGMSLL